MSIYSANLYNSIVSGTEKDLKPTLEEAVADFQGGMHEAFNYLMFKYDSAFQNNVFRYGGNDDVYQELSMCLLNAARKYKVGQTKTKFNSYFWSSAQNWLGSWNIKNNAQRRCAPGGTVSIYTENEEGEMLLNSFADDAEPERTEDRAFRAYIQEIVNPLLPELDQNIIQLIMDGYSKTDIAHTLGVSNVTVHKHITKLRNNEEFRAAIYAYSA